MGLLRSDKWKCKCNCNWNWSRKKLLSYFVLLPFFFYGCSYDDEPVLISNQNGSKKLTLMIYMAADDDLESYALANLKEIEKALIQEVNVLVLLDRSEGYDETCGNWTDTRLFQVVHDASDTSTISSRRIDCPALGLSSSEAAELDMANPSVLQKFIEFGRTSYKTEKYALIIWGHGSGWKAFAIDDRSKTYMSVKELGNAVRGQGLSVIGFDTCFGGALENGYELKDCAEFTVGCPGVSPNSGWNYKSLFEMLSGGDFSSDSIALAMGQSSRVETSVFDNTKISGLMAAFEDFCKNLSESIRDESGRRQVLENLLASKSYSYSQYPCDMFLDVKSMAELYTSSENASLSVSAGRLLSITNEISGPGISLNFIPMDSLNVMSAAHSEDYVKNINKTNQCAFIKESNWWVPTLNGNSGSLLDKLFYSTF